MKEEKTPAHIEPLKRPFRVRASVVISLICLISQQTREVTSGDL